MIIFQIILKFLELQILKLTNLFEQNELKKEMNEIFQREAHEALKERDISRVMLLIGRMRRG